MKYIIIKFIKKPLNSKSSGFLNFFEKSDDVQNFMADDGFRLIRPTT